MKDGSCDGAVCASTCALFISDFERRPKNSRTNTWTKLVSLCPAAVVPCGSRAVPGACPVSSDNKKRVIYRSSSGIELFFFSPEDTEGLHMHVSSPCVKSAPHHAGPGRAATQRTNRAQGVRCQPRPERSTISSTRMNPANALHTLPLPPQGSESVECRPSLCALLGPTAPRASQPPSYVVH